MPDRTPQPYRFQLDREVVTIGRGSVNDIAVDCASVSVRHAEMVRIEGGYELRDLASTNGTKLDGKRMDVVPLRHGMTVKLGDVSFDFQLSEEERAALAREKELEPSPVLREAVDEPVEGGGAGGAVAAPVRRAVPKKPVVVDSGTGGAGFFMFLMFLVFAAVAFFTGLSIRHYKDTGGGLLEGIQTRSKTLKEKAARGGGEATPAQTAPAPAAPAAEVAPGAGQ